MTRLRHHSKSRAKLAYTKRLEGLGHLIGNRSVIFLGLKRFKHAIESMIGSPCPKWSPLGKKKPSFVSTAESYFFIYDADEGIPRGERSLPSIRNILSFFGKLKRIAVGFFSSLGAGKRPLALTYIYPTEGPISVFKRFLKKKNGRFKKLDGFCFVLRKMCRWLRGPIHQ